MLDSNKFSSSEKQLNISETWNWANYDISLNNTNHNGNGVSSTLTPQWNSNIPAYIIDQTTLNNTSMNIIYSTTLSTINNNINLYKPAYSTKLYHTYQGNIEQNKCLTNFPNSNHIHLPSIESVRRITYNNNNLNHSYNNESYSTCHYDHQHKPEYTLPPITYPNIEQYETDLRNLTKTNELNHTTTHNNNNLDQIVDYLPVIHTDTTITNYLVSSTPNPLIHLNQIDQYNLITCNELKGNDNSFNIIHDDKNIIDESKDNSSLTVQQHLWDIKDLKLPKVNYYDSYELWPTGHCRRVYAQTCERARRHQSGWAMRNTNNHNPQVLKKSCLGVLECSMNCMVQGKPLSLRPAICDKARKKQCNRECITPGCKGRLILRNCRGHSGYPVTHFWRFANGAVYFEAKGEHDHNRPSLKTFGLSETDTVTTTTTTTTIPNTMNLNVTTATTPTNVDSLVTGITTTTITTPVSPDIKRDLNHLTNHNNNIQYIHHQNPHLHDQLPPPPLPQQQQQGCHDYGFLPQYEQSLSNEFCNYYTYPSSDYINLNIKTNENHLHIDNSPLLSKTKHIGKRGTNRKGIRREKKLTNTYLKKQQKYENYYKKLSNESNCTLNDIKRNRKNQQNTRSDQINKFKIPIKTDENDNDPIFYDDPFHGDTIHNGYPMNILNNNLWNNETMNQIDSSLNQSIDKEQYNTTEINTMNYPYYSDPLFTTTSLPSLPSSSPSSITMTTVNRHQSSLPFWNSIQDLDSYSLTHHNSNNYITNTIISTMYSSPNWSLSPSILSSSSSLSSSSVSYSNCTTCALSLPSLPSSLSLYSTNISKSFNKQIVSNSTEVIQCDPLTTSLSNLNGNESFFIQYNNCSYLNKPKYLSSSYNEYPQSVLINSMYRENDESNPVQFNDINNEICHSTPQQSTYIDDYHYYYYYYYSNPCLSILENSI
uniref:GCM domain-containing protein n=1 Tax=Schistosoma mansoni TaxID=6183 RepID=A0A5K4FC61_SCHMA